MTSFQFFDAGSDVLVGRYERAHPDERTDDIDAHLDGPTTREQLAAAPNHCGECLKLAIGLVQQGEDIAYPTSLLCGFLVDG